MREASQKRRWERRKGKEGKGEKYVREGRRHSSPLVTAVPGIFRTSYTTMWLALCRGLEEGGRRRKGGVQNRNEINFNLDLTSHIFVCIHNTDWHK